MMATSRDRSLRRQASIGLGALLAACVAACTDVGDSSSGFDGMSIDEGAVETGPVEGGSSDSTIDGMTPSGIGADTAMSTEADAMLSDGGGSTIIDDAGDTTTGSPGPADSGAQDATAPDATLGSDAPPNDAGAPETRAPDAGPDATVDAGGPDSGPADTGAADSSGPDAADAGTDAADGAPADSASVDTGAPDTGAPDSGAGGISACTAAPCATSGPNSVKCQGSPNGVCTPTEAIIVNYDIAKGTTTASGNSPAKSCYMCMVVNACLNADGTTNTLATDVTNVECGDPDVATPNPPFTIRNVSSTNAANCRDAIACILYGNADPGATGATEPQCTLTLPPPKSTGNCFCGANRGAACIASPTSPIGVCASREFTDMATINPTTVVAKFTDPSVSPGGVGNMILNCALGAGNAGACAGLPCFK